MMKLGRGSGGYYIIYERRSKLSSLSVVFPTIESKPFMVIGGRRASRLFEFLRHLFREYGLILSHQREETREVIEVPWATGLATVVFMLATYSSSKPLLHADLLERLISGRMPLSSYFLMMPDLAQSLSEYMDYVLGTRGERNQVLRPEAVRVVSRIMGEILEALNDLEKRVDKG